MDDKETMTPPAGRPLKLARAWVSPNEKTGVPNAGDVLDLAWALSREIETIDDKKVKVVDLSPRSAVRFLGFPCPKMTLPEKTPEPVNRNKPALGPRQRSLQNMGYEVSQLTNQDAESYLVKLKQIFGNNEPTIKLNQVDKVHSKFMEYRRSVPRYKFVSVNELNKALKSLEPRHVNVNPMNGKRKALKNKIRNYPSTGITLNYKQLEEIRDNPDFDVPTAQREILNRFGLNKSTPTKPSVFPVAPKVPAVPLRFPSPSQLPRNPPPILTRSNSARDLTEAVLKGEITDQVRRLFEGFSSKNHEEQKKIIQEFKKWLEHKKPGVTFDEILRREKRAERLLNQEVQRAILVSMYHDVLSFIAEKGSSVENLKIVIAMLMETDRDYEQFKKDLSIIRHEDLATFDLPGPSSGNGRSKPDKIKRWLMNAEGATNQKELENLVKKKNPRWHMGEYVEKRVDQYEGLEGDGGSQ
jgi:hypothetical protein